MKTPALFLVLLLWNFSQIHAQVAIPDQQKVSFDITMVGDTAFRTLLLYNPWSDTVDLSIFIPNRPGSNAFLAMGNEKLDISLPPYDTLSIRLAFVPIQNTSTKGTLHIRSEASYGNLKIDLQGKGKFTNPYYAPTEDLWNEALIEALKDILSEGQQTFSYNRGRDIIFLEVDNLTTYPNQPDSNSLLCMYTHRRISGFNTRKEAQSQGFNTEHVWPQSQFEKKLPMKSDLHHIFPVDAKANNRRSNHPFGPIEKVRWEKQGSQLGENNNFLPREESRGIIARAMFYIATRYENYQDFLISQEESLREWHHFLPPDSMEILRNEKVFAIQGNRNPFIDYPQLVYRIASFRWAEDSLADFSPAFPPLPKLISQDLDLTEPAQMKRYKEKNGTWKVVFQKKENQKLRIYDANGVLLKKWNTKRCRIRVKAPEATLLLYEERELWKGWLLPKEGLVVQTSVQ